MEFIGIDTSNYTTSIARYNGVVGRNCSKLLPVKNGELGLRQSDAVFNHIKSLPELSGRLFSDLNGIEIGGVGVSTRPRAIEGSYMPCFLVGLSHASILADAFHVQLVSVSHQQGHIAAALYSAGRLDLLDTPHLAWHLSGGTTELLLVEPENKNVRCTRIGGTSDISAGQLIDRVGQLLGIAFPSGKELDRISVLSSNSDYFPVKCKDSFFSFSGVQNKAVNYHDKIGKQADTARYTLLSIANAVRKATEQALERYPGMPVVFSGGVASNSLLRSTLQGVNIVFAEPQFSTDNAMGVAVLAHRILGR